MEVLLGVKTCVGICVLVGRGVKVKVALGRGEGKAVGNAVAVNVFDAVAEDVTVAV